MRKTLFGFICLLLTIVTIKSALLKMPTRKIASLRDSLKSFLKAVLSINFSGSSMRSGRIQNNTSMSSGLHLTQRLS